MGPCLGKKEIGQGRHPQKDRSALTWGSGTKPRRDWLWVLRESRKFVTNVQHFATPWTVAPQAPLSMTFSRQEYYSGLPFPSRGHLPDPGIKPKSPDWQANSLPLRRLGSPHRSDVCPLLWVWRSRCLLWQRTGKGQPRPNIQDEQRSWHGSASLSRMALNAHSAPRSRGSLPICHPSLLFPGIQKCSSEGSSGNSRAPRTSRVIQISQYWKRKYWHGSGWWQRACHLRQAATAQLGPAGKSESGQIWGLFREARRYMCVCINIHI